MWQKFQIKNNHMKQVNKSKRQINLIRCRKIFSADNKKTLEDETHKQS
jgi:hypothetical protein